MDLWVVAALIVLIATMRVYRLNEPADMHFDEVYHARTATEFLQDWKYGIDHDIYEWTHPHFAKYAIATGITVFSDDKVTSTGTLNVPVKDVVVQPRQAYSPAADDPNTAERTADPDLRYGDRVFVATGSEVRVYDLSTRRFVHTYAIPGASAFSSVGITGLVYVGTAEGRIYRIDTNTLDDVRLGKSQTVEAPVLLGVKTEINIARVYTDTPPYALVADSAGTVVSVDLTGNDGAIVGRGSVPGAADFAPLGSGPTTVTADPRQVTDASALAQLLAEDVPGAYAAEIELALRASLGGLEIAVPLGPLSSEQVTLIKSQIDAGTLPGLSISSSSPQVLVAYQSGVGLLDARHVVINSTIETDQPATSLAVNSDSQQVVYVAAGAQIILIRTDATGGTATASKDGNQPLERMPGVVTRIVFDKGTNVAHALGRTPDGQGWTVYAIETNAQRRVLRRAAPIRACCDRPRFFTQACHRESRGSAHIRRRRINRLGGRWAVRLLLADRGRHVRHPDGRLHVPADPAAVPAPYRGTAGGALHADGRNALRPVAHCHERHVRRRPASPRLPDICRALAQQMEESKDGLGGLLDRHADTRRGPGARSFGQVGCRLRHRSASGS